MAASAEPPVQRQAWECFSWLGGVRGLCKEEEARWAPSRDVHNSRETRAENQEGYMGATWAWRRELGCPGSGL